MTTCNCLSRTVFNGNFAYLFKIKIWLSIPKPCTCLSYNNTLLIVFPEYMLRIRKPTNINTSYLDVDTSLSVINPRTLWFMPFCSSKNHPPLYSLSAQWHSRGNQYSQYKALNSIPFLHPGLSLFKYHMLINWVIIEINLWSG